MSFIKSIARFIKFGQKAGGEAQKNNLSMSNMPPYRKALLFLSDGEPPPPGMVINALEADGIHESGVKEPSTIYTVLPVNGNVSIGDDVPKMGYFPNYASMSPEQRTIYIYWLCNVEVPVDIGYVFVYFYGLERHLVYGDFDAAVNEILLLRKHHDNGSFQHYSAAALLHACLLRQRMDVLQHLYVDLGFDYFENSVLVLLYQQKVELNVDMLLRLAQQLRGVNRRYLKEDAALYATALLSELMEVFGKASYPFFEMYDLNKIKGGSYPVFANYSLPPKIRTPAIPNFFDHAPFERKMGDFFQKVHERTKALKKERKKTATVKTLSEK